MEGLALRQDRWEATEERLMAEKYNKNSCETSFHKIFCYSQANAWDV